MLVFFLHEPPLFSYFFVTLGKVLTITSKVLFKVYFKKAFYIPENSNNYVVN